MDKLATVVCSIDTPRIYGAEQCGWVEFTTPSGERVVLTRGTIETAMALSDTVYQPEEVLI